MMRSHSCGDHILTILGYRKDKKGMNQFLREHDEYRHLDEDTAVVISGLMGVGKFMSDRERYKEGSGYNMTGECACANGSK